MVTRHLIWLPIIFPLTDNIKKLNIFVICIGRFRPASQVICKCWSWYLSGLTLYVKNIESFTWFSFSYV